jgi:hypothetical protein
MPERRIDVPPDHRDDLLRELLTLYSQKAEAINRAVDEYLADERKVRALLDHRAELAEVDVLIDQLGWRLQAPRTATRLVGEEHLLAEIGHAALNSAVDDLGESVGVGSAGPREVEAIGRTLRRVNALFGLLQTIYRPAPSPAH